MIDRRGLLAGAAAGVAAMAIPPARAAAGSDDAATLGRISEGMLASYPENASFLGVDTGARAAMASELGDRSMAANARRAAECGRWLATLKAGGSASVDAGATHYAVQQAADGYRFPYGDVCVLNTWQAESNSPYVVAQGSGLYATIPDFLDSVHKVEDVAGAEAYCARLSAMARGLDAEDERVRHDAGLGVVLPDFLLATTLKLQKDYAARPVAEWGLVGSLARRAKAHGLPGDWEARARTICEKEVAPALARQIATLEGLVPRATPDAGCWKLPDGEAYYRWALNVGTTTGMDADEVHRLGLEQSRAIGAEMDTLLKRQGLTKGSVGERMSALGKDQRYLYPNTDAGRADLIAYLNDVLARIRAKLPQAFGKLPATPLVVKRVPPSIEAGAPDGYMQDGPLDGSAPASYYINLRDTGNWPKYSLPTLCFHEGLPGHAWQGAFSHGLPLIRSQLMFNAYVEGWALYAEQLGAELGMYEGDPVGRLGYLQSIQFRACRLVVDTGLHAKRWTREQAIAWMVAENGNPLDSARGEIDRYCAWPGQACGYQVGHLRIAALRTKAKAALGSRFDLRSFDDAVLAQGSVPLDLLDREIGAYIARGGA